MKGVGRTLRVIAFFVGFSFSLQAQSFQLVEKISEGVSSISRDGYGNLLLNKITTIEKYHLDSGKITSSYSALSQGDVSCVDTKNSFKIMVFSEPYQQLFYLDNRLTVLSQRVSLSGVTQSQIQCVCASYNDAFWMYEPMCSCLKRVNREGVVTNTTNPLSLYLDDTLFCPTQLLEFGNYVVALDTNYGLLFFDLFGNFIRPYPISGCRYVAESGSSLLLLTRESLCFLPERMGEPLYRLPLPQTGCKAVLSDGKNLFLLSGEGELFHYIYRDF